jgi:hypothetical protein
MRQSLLALSVVLASACGDSANAPRLASGDFDFTIASDAAALHVAGSDAHWDYTGGGVSIQFSTPDTVIGFTGPLLFVVSAGRAPLFGGNFLPGKYGLGAASDYFFAVSLFAENRVLRADSGSIIVRSSRPTAGEELIWDAKIDVWCTDSTAPSTPFRLRGQFAAPYAPGSLLRADAIGHRSNNAT